MKKIPLFLVLVLGVVSLYAGGSSEKPAAPAGGSAFADEIVIGEVADAKYIDPWESLGSREIRYTNLVYDNLLLTSWDGSGFIPSLATSWEVSADGLTYTFKLKPNIRFSNGDPATEADWQFSFYRARDCQTSNALSRASMINTVSMPDPQTLVVKITEPTPPFLSYLTSYNLVLASKKHFDTVGEEQFKFQPMGTGPYVLKEWRMNERAIFEANSYYHNANQGLPKTKRIRYETVSDDNTCFIQLQAGVLDIVIGMPLPMAAQLASQPNIQGLSFVSTQMRHMEINVTKPPLDNIKVREALRYLTDKREIANIVAFGQAEPSASSIPSAHGAFLNKNIKDPPVDINKAKALLAEAGYSNGVKLTISISGSAQVYVDIATILKSQWAKGGVDLTIEPLESGALTDKFQSLGHQITLLQWTDGGSDPASLLGFICDYSESMNWYTGLNNREIAALYEQSKHELNVDKRVALVHQIQEIVWNQHCIIPLFTAKYLYGANKKVHDIDVSTGNRLNVEYLYKDR
ncbi:MAG: ABC transporter substrate-binding protein [Treponema sp.]|jgi:peptide/nickel transport system substrate-binding protein|nr:ABC transporter substrate-binding protein [Treponema sp.]